MAFDFDPDLSAEVEANVSRKETTSPSKAEVISNQETNIVLNGTMNQDVVTVNNLLALTQSHMQDDLECRRVVEDLTEELNNSIQLMSTKDLLDYLKIKIREREFHVQCIFKAYDFIQKSEYAREAFAGSDRRERIINATSQNKIKGLLNILRS